MESSMLKNIATPQTVFDLNAKALEALLAHIPQGEEQSLECSADLEVFLTSQGIMRDRVKALERLLDSMQSQIEAAQNSVSKVPADELVKRLYSEIVDHNQQP